MTYFSTCLNCAVDKAACGKRKAVRSAIKGLGITSAKFRCEDRVARFRRGQRVQFIWRYYDDAGEGRRDGYETVFVGTVMHEKAGNKRFAVKVDPDHEIYDLKPGDILKNAEFTSVRPDDMVPADEPDRALCPLCSADDVANDAQRLCWGRGDLSNVAWHGCLRT